MANHNNRGGGHNQPLPMSQRLQRERKNLPEFLKFGGYFCQLVPTIFLVLYITGAWESKFDEYGRLGDFDTLVYAFVTGVSLFGLAILWFTHHLYEKE